MVKGNILTSFFSFVNSWVFLFSFLTQNMNHKKQALKK